jgi:hypothetical protein
MWNASHHRILDAFRGRRVARLRELIQRSGLNEFDAVATLLELDEECCVVTSDDDPGPQTDVLLVRTPGQSFGDEWRRTATGKACVGGDHGEEAQRKETIMPVPQPSWIATAGTVRGVEICIGLAARTDMDHVVASITSPRLQAYTGAQARVAGSDDPWPVCYLAVRSPHVAEVRLQGPARRQSELRHVRVTLDTGAERGLTPVRRAREPVSTVGFIVTIGLPPAQEQAFFGAIMGNEEVVDWRGVYRRLLEAVRGETSPGKWPRDTDLVISTCVHGASRATSGGS